MQTQLNHSASVSFPLADAHTHTRITVGPATFATTLFGSKHGYDWSLSQLADIKLRSEYQGRLGRVHQALTLGDAYVVNATEFNAKILKPADFTVRTISGQRFVQAPDKPAEGMSLAVGDAGVQSPAGCLTIVAARYNSFDSRVILPVKAHAGRWSLIRPRASHRSHESVCYAVLDALDVLNHPREAKDVWVKLLWGIRPEDFPHPCKDSVHAETNKWLWCYIKKNGWEQGSVFKDNTAYLNLAMIAKAQFMQRGVPEHQIDLTDAYLPRTDVYKDGCRGQPRNLVVVKRLS